MCGGSEQRARVSHKQEETTGRALISTETVCAGGGTERKGGSGGESARESTAAVASDADTNLPEIQRFWIGPETADCVGVGPQTCLVLRRSADGNEEFFYESIEGFTHQAGTSYVIDVEVTRSRIRPPKAHRSPTS